MKHLCAMAAAALAVSSLGCQAVSPSAATGANQSQVIQTSHIEQSQFAPRPQLRPIGARGGAPQHALISQRAGIAGAGHLAQSRHAPRPQIERATCLSCSPQCGCDDCGCGDSCGDGCCGSCGGCGCGACGGSGMCCDGNNGINGIVSGLLDCNGCGGSDAAYNFQPGPPVGQVAYPYYTVRGPRDFLARNPRSIGPTGAYGCPK